MGIMSGKICIITGGAGSIGHASAALLLQEGARVMLVGHNEENLARTARTLNASPDFLGIMKANVADSRETQKYINHTVAKWGKIDVLFSHAGISGVVKPVIEYPEEVFDTVMAVNVRASFLACKYGLPQMNDGSSIIITSSIMGVRADPGVCAYATSKHALIGLMRTVAKEVASRNIRVNILAPGPIDNSFQSKIEERLTEVVGQDGTEFLNRIIPLGRHGQAEEIARMVLFLASDQSSFSTGSVFMADGGMNI
ncbi:MAG TPA: SDR family NAD(P)-dependent oxidoreductase [Dehalococcoidales bacterium]|nr:SDR family NAD(P)-dependent oxidoreductase [Dehalococcoidales bacterium]